ncbi:BnaCnng29290D [Brassica napus]|uniref:BnaCnng29290D protein n=1 Tax=Brassica napus TaxID=3708 RepID=A0A078J1G9_BRANA|nr:BnaCnng29290D [Brassica napus]
MVKTEVKTEKLDDDITIKDNKHRRRVVCSADALDRKFKRTVLCVAKPSYLLSLLERSSTRCNYLKRLPKILSELLRQRNWREASGVLSVLMQGTMRDGSPSMNRLKYEAQIQIVSHLQPDKNNVEEIERIYDTWIGKIGKQHKEERLLVWFEQICHLLEHGMEKEAEYAAIGMMRSRDLGNLPRTNLYIGITCYRLWCRKYSEELEPKDADCSDSISNMSQSGSGVMAECSPRNESVYSVESSGSVRNVSEASVGNYEVNSDASTRGSGSVVEVKVKLENVKVEESSQHFTEPPRIYASSEENEEPLRDGVSFDPALIQILGEMDPWLLPLKPPEDPDCHGKIVNDSFYKDAVSYLRLTMQSPRYVSLAALHPLVQLLLIGGRVDEAMKLVEEMCQKVHDIKPLRIRAAMKEKFHNNSDELAKCYEDVLEIDPSCVTTLKKLVEMSKEDGYSRESLIEMIALHVEASFPEPQIWKEFAEMLILFFENVDEDRMSVCLNGDGEEGCQQTYSVRYNRTPRMFTGTSWTLRAKWWLNRHFSPEILETEMKKLEAEQINGDLEMLRLMSFKAACASRLYGPEFGYVTTVYGMLENGRNSLELFNFVRRHRQNWNRIYNLE